MAVRHPDICGTCAARPERRRWGNRRPLQPATSSACSFDSTRTERTASTCSAGRSSSACSSTATGATWRATAVGDPSGPTLLPHGAPGNAHRALPGQLGALRRVHGGLKDGSWSARRPQRAPLAAAGAGRDRLRENPPRQGFFEHPEYLAVRAHLPAPWQDILDLAYYSGWRKQEILGLTWDEIDRAGGVIRLSPARSKTLVGADSPHLTTHRRGPGAAAGTP